MNFAKYRIQQINEVRENKETDLTPPKVKVPPLALDNMNAPPKKKFLAIPIK